MKAETAFPKMSERNKMDSKTQGAIKLYVLNEWGQSLDEFLSTYIEELTGYLGDYTECEESISMLIDDSAFSDILTEVLYCALEKVTTVEHTPTVNSALL